MSQQKQAPDTAETYRYFIKQFVDQIQDVNYLWKTYSIVRAKAEREAQECPIKRKSLTPSPTSAGAG